MRNVSGGASAGCGIFGLLGLLISIGIIAFLGAKTMGSLGTGGGSNSGPTPVMSAVHLSKSGLLSDGDEVVVTTHALPADTPVLVLTCLNLDHDPLATGLDAPRCDDTTRILGRSDANHRLKVVYRIHRNIEIDFRPLDCAIQVGECTLRVEPLGDHPAKPLDLALSFTPRA